MRRSQFDYRSYRGRATLTDWLKRIALVLAVLVVLAGVLLFLGWKPPFSLPFSPSPSQSQEEPDAPDGALPDQSSDPAPDDQDEDAAQPEPPVEEQAASLLSVPVSALLDGSARSLAEQSGADGVLVDMKDALGALGWQSQQPLASSLQDGIPAETVNETLAAWNAEGLYTAARLSCFRDEALGGQMEYTLRTSSDYRWRDGSGCHWAAPSNQAVQDYLVGLMTELAQMGFDELVLDYWGYPAQADGPLGNLKRGENYPEGSLDAVTGGFLDKAAQALASYDVRLSLCVSGAVLDGTDSSTGLTPAALAGVDRIWTEADRTAALTALTGAGLPWTEDRLVSLSDQLDPDLPVPQAVWENGT